MALTPDDVVVKQFQHVRFKEGFDPEEVDDFLDEIVVEWRKTIAENEELKAKLAELEARGAEPQAVAAPVEVVEEAPVAAAAVVEPEPEPVAPPQSSAGIIELAQRLHDEHVAEGQAQHDRLVSEAQATATRIVEEAEAKERELTSRLERERVTLEARISELRQFERDYRTKLRAYIEGQLNDLDASTPGPDGNVPNSAAGF